MAYIKTDVVFCFNSANRIVLTPATEKVNERKSDKNVKKPKKTQCVRVCDKNFTTCQIQNQQFNSFRDFFVFFSKRNYNMENPQHMLFSNHEQIQPKNLRKPDNGICPSNKSSYICFTVKIILYFALCPNFLCINLKDAKTTS